MTAEPMRSGFACIVGRPNVGKSTLVNALVGQKIAITSARPQTTRHVIRGVVHRPDAQLVLVDTPGLHKPRTLLGKRLNDRVERQDRIQRFAYQMEAEIEVKAEKIFKKMKEAEEMELKKLFNEMKK